MADACPVTPGCGCGPSEPVDLRAWWRIGLGALIAANSMTVSLAVNTSQVAPSERTTVHAVLAGLAVACLALLGWPLARTAVAELARRRVTLEAMFLTGIGGAFTASAVAALTGHGEVYFEIVSILLVVYSVGQQLAASARARALAAVEQWVPDATSCTIVDDDGATRQVRVADLEVGWRVRVAPGETIPADGPVLAGTAFVREAEMTGEPFVVVRRPGDRVWAGTHAVDASLTLTVDAAPGSRRIDGIVAAVAAARAAPATVERQADHLVQWFLPLVLAAALLTFAGWWWQAGWQRGLFNAMAVLLVACPCALGLATPLAVWATLARLAGRGLVARGGEAVERLAAVDTVVFDKTGTLTGAEAVLVDLVVAESAGWARSEVRALLATVEGGLRHPLAAALAGDVTPDGRFTAECTELLPAAGVRASVEDGRRGVTYVVAVGEPAALLEASEAKTWEKLAAGLRLPEGARTAALVVDGRPVAAMAVDERLRDSWPDALAALRRLGLATLVMSGDSAARVAAIGADYQLGGLGPEDKLAEVHRLMAAGRRVLFVGDGVNDAAGMAASHASVAVAGGTDLAREVGDITWHGGDLRAVPWAVARAREAVAGIRSNLRLAAVYNTIGVGLAVAGLLHPVSAAVLMTASSLVVTWRATGTLRAEQAQREAGEPSPSGLQTAKEAA